MIPESTPPLPTPEVPPPSRTDGGTWINPQIPPSPPVPREERETPIPSVRRRVVPVPDQEES